MLLGSINKLKTKKTRKFILAYNVGASTSRPGRLNAPGWGSRMSMVGSPSGGKTANILVTNKKIYSGASPQWCKHILLDPTSKGPQYPTITSPWKPRFQLMDLWEPARSRLPQEEMMFWVEKRKEGFIGKRIRFDILLQIWWEWIENIVEKKRHSMFLYWQYQTVYRRQSESGGGL